MIIVQCTQNPILSIKAPTITIVMIVAVLQNQPKIGSNDYSHYIKIA